MGDGINDLLKGCASLLWCFSRFSRLSNGLDSRYLWACVDSVVCWNGVNSSDCLPFPSSLRAYPLNRNRVASSRPSPSLGATFLRRYEFVKSVQLATSSHSNWSYDTPCSKTRIFRSSPDCTLSEMPFSSRSASLGFIVPGGSICRVDCNHRPAS